MVKTNSATVDYLSHFISLKSNFLTTDDMLADLKQEDILKSFCKSFFFVCLFFKTAPVV